MIRRTFKFRIYPTKAQITSMSNGLNACRWLYNKILERRKTAFEEHGISMTHYDTMVMLPKLKQDNEFLKIVHSQVLQNVCTRVDLAFQNFFRRVKSGEEPGYPRFKGEGYYKSITFPQTGFKLIGKDRLKLSKIGDVRIKQHRPIEGKIKALHVKRDLVGKWYACFSVETTTKVLPPSSKVVGIDVGLESFATLSDGEKIENPRFLRKSKKALEKADRALSKAKKGTKKRKKKIKVIQHVNAKIANRRSDFAHKLSSKLIGEYQFLALEDLEIKSMMSGNFRSMNRSIGDVAWSQFRQYITHKAESAGRVVVFVDPRNTSKMCSGCGKIVEKKLSDRIHNCPFCKLEFDRDLNASLNILARGLASFEAKSPHRSPCL